MATQPVPVTEPEVIVTRCAGVRMPNIYGGSGLAPVEHALDCPNLPRLDDGPNVSHGWSEACCRLVKDSWR